jgi:ubiquinone/menaquinone biosynthesis C-methylase UbiE
MHTIHSKPFITANESLHYLEECFKEYPLYRELMDVWGKHDDEVILDYGCGPGNDLVGFLAYSGAQKVIGIDVSKKALELASQRL